MSAESIIGITSGLIGIATFVMARVCWLRNKFKKLPADELFSKLMDKKTSDAFRRKILKRLNKTPLINNRIKEDYIQKFELLNRGPETVLFDICDSNNIEPTDDICKSILKASMPSLRKKYQEKRQNNNEQSSAEPVLLHELNETKKAPNQKGEQMVYMSELLKVRYPQTCENLIRILDKHNVKYAFLKGTKDIWCRDYMPIQTESGKFIQFKYDPSYLKGNKEWEDSRTDVDEACRLNNIIAQRSDINLDGGNVLICDGRAILTDRIFSENPNKGKEELVNELSKLLECEIIIIPALKSKEEDFTGHADGMVRFVNRNVIVGNKLSNEYQYIQKGMQKVIEQYGLKYIDMPFFEPKDSKHPESAIGVYVNYLEVNNLIVLPVFGRDEEDKQAVDVIRKAFPDKVVETINYNDVAQKGGLLNCTTWVITPQLQ
ncbi:MAG: agmatine deiminase family protein [Bacteroidaceae bacterium]|nr:agmatine deiminase family protein [Bacteroidaceae bacterium]